MHHAQIIVHRETIKVAFTQFLIFLEFFDKNLIIFPYIVNKALYFLEVLTRRKDCMKRGLLGEFILFGLVIALFNINMAGLNKALWAQGADSGAVVEEKTPDEAKKDTEKPVTKDLTPAKAEEIVVTARRTAQDYSTVPDNISVLNADKLSIMPVGDLAEALNLVTGVDMQARGFLGHPSSVTIQGSNPRHVRVMVDGVLLNSQGTAFADPSLIPIDNVERIEIIKGTGSSVWGSSLGGVINVVTKSPRSNRKFEGDITLSGGGGAYDFNKQALRFTGQVGNLGYMLWGSMLNTDSEFRTNSDVDSQKASGKATYFLSDRSNLEISFHYSGSKVGEFEYDAALPVNWYGITFQEDLVFVSRYGSIKYTTILETGIEFNATAKISNQDSRLDDIDIATGDVLGESNTKDVFTGLDLQGKYQINDKQNVIVGVDLGQDKLDSAIHDYIWLYDNVMSEETLTRQGYYASYSLLINDNIDATLGGRYDDNEAYGSQFSPSAGVVYHLPFYQTNLRFVAAKAFNAPPLVYRYTGMPPNVNLKAEKTPKTYEFGIDAKPLSELYVKLGFYYALIEDYVVYDWATDTMYNVNKIKRQGFETEANYNVLDELQVNTGCSFNRAVDLTLNSAHQPFQDQAVAKLTYNAGLNYKRENLNVNFQGNYRFWNENPLFLPKDRKFIWDLRANYDLNQGKDRNVPQGGSMQDSRKGKSNLPVVFVSLYNVFDTEYWYNYLFPMPGRRIEAGIKYAW